MLINKSLLYDELYPLNDNQEIKHPAVHEVISFGELDYYSLINLFLVYPIDIIVELYEMVGKSYKSFFEYYEKLTQYDIFIMLYGSNTELYNKLIKFFLGDVDFVLAQHKDTQDIILYDDQKDIVFDLTSFMIMSNFIRTIHHIPNDPSKTAKKSKTLMKVLIETGIANKQFLTKQREKDKMSGKTGEQLNKLMSKISIASQFKRDDLKDMRLYEFYETLNQVISYAYWQFKMGAYFSGNIDTSKVNKKELEWFYD